MAETRTRPDRGRPHLGRALTLIHSGQAPTRAVLTERLGVTRATAGAVAAELADRRLITVDTRPSGGGGQGRPSHRLEVHPAGPVVLAAQLNVHSFHVALAALGGTLVVAEEHPLDERLSPEQVLTAIAEAGAALVRARRRRCVGAGLAVPASVPQPERTVLFSPYLGWPPGLPAGALFARAVRRAEAADGPDLPVEIGNDANLEALAEHRHGAGRGARQLLHVTTGHRGVGGALVVDGRLHTGSRGLALEVGHLPVEPDGPPCACGARGCLESVTDPRALVTAAGRDPAAGCAASRLTSAAQADLVLRDAAAGDPDARRGVRTVAERLGRGLGALANVLDPDRVLLGGMFTAVHREEGGEIARTMTARSLAAGCGTVPLCGVALPRPALVGAAELAWQPLLDDPVAVLGG